MEKIKILYIIDTITSIAAGSERQLSLLISHLDSMRFEPHLMLLRSSEWLKSKYYACPGNVLGMRSVMSFSGFRKTRELAHYIRENRYPLVQTFFPDANVVGVIAARWAGRSAIISTRRNSGFWHTTKTLLATRFANRYVDAFLANSEVTAQANIRKEGIAPAKFSVIYNGLDSSRFQITPELIEQARERLGFDRNIRIIGIVANLRPVKDLRTFLRACQLVRKNHDKVGFVIIGGGEIKMTAELKNLAESLGLRRSVRFMGEIENPIPYMKNFDVGVLSSLSEGLSNTLLEYAGAGIPSVATDTGGNPEIVQHQKTGILVKVGDYQGMSEAILRLLHDEALRLQYGQDAAEAVWTKFDLDTSIKLHQDLYTKLYNQAKSMKPSNRL